MFQKKCSEGVDYRQDGLIGIKLPDVAPALQFKPVITIAHLEAQGAAGCFPGKGIPEGGPDIYPGTVCILNKDAIIEPVNKVKSFYCVKPDLREFDLQVGVFGKFVIIANKKIPGLKAFLIFLSTFNGISLVPFFFFDGNTVGNFVTFYFLDGERHWPNDRPVSRVFFIRTTVNFKIGIVKHFRFFLFLPLFFFVFFQDCL